MKKEPHRFIPIPNKGPTGKLPWNYCARCGLVRLKNTETLQAVRLGCNWKEILEKSKRV